jgi:hypothetical protein
MSCAVKRSGCTRPASSDIHVTQLARVRGGDGRGPLPGRRRVQGPPRSPPADLLPLLESSHNCSSRGGGGGGAGRTRRTCGLTDAARPASRGFSLDSALGGHDGVDASMDARIGAAPCAGRRDAPAGRRRRRRRRGHGRGVHARRVHAESHSPGGARLGGAAERAAAADLAELTRDAALRAQRRGGAAGEWRCTHPGCGTRRALDGTFVPLR